ncbi:MAG: hypothetical protein OEW56_11775 [Gemmatimonadota bacterium]|nr:hypothetical protein [Gemmatimonadota bacterium]
MTKRFLGAVALGVGLTLVPVTVRSSDDGKIPTLAVSETCARPGNCCFSLGDLCLQGDEIMANWRLTGDIACTKPGG